MRKNRIKKQEDKIVRRLFMKKKIAYFLVIILILGAMAFTGCSFGKSAEEEPDGDTTEAETVISTLKNDNITITGNLQTAVNIRTEKIKSDKDLYSTIKNTVAKDNLVYIEIYYINLYDNTDEKVQQGGNAEFKFKLSEAMKNAGGDTYELYYYNSSEGEAYPVEFEIAEGIIRFSTENIGFFAILNVNNSGVEIIRPTMETETERVTEAPVVKPTEATAVKPTEAPAIKPTEAPTARPTEAPTEAPTEKPTIILPTKEPETQPTEPQTETPTEEVIPTIAASGNNETPSVRVFNPLKGVGGFSTMYTITVYNDGNYTMRILKTGCGMAGANTTSGFDSELRLVSDPNIPNPISYLDIPAGGKKDVTFVVLKENTLYNTKTTTEFRFYYDGSTYVCRTSSSSGTAVNKLN